MDWSHVTVLVLSNVILHAISWIDTYRWKKDTAIEKEKDRTLAKQLHGQAREQEERAIQTINEHARALKEKNDAR